MDKNAVKIAVIDLNNGVPNQGLRCIRDLLKQTGENRSEVGVVFDFFDARHGGELPGISYDIFISSGGPGSPYDGQGQSWEKNYFNLLDRIYAHNQNGNPQKKYVFFICHSFQMMVRFFGGWDFEDDDALRRDPAQVGYSKGVPMGSDLPRGDGAPSFLVYALRDAMGANLDRIQIVKGWLDSDDNPRERVYDVAWSDGREVGANGKLPPVGSTVDLAIPSWTNTIGAPELGTVWTDPDFDADEHAFYYARVIEIPTPRWTAYDATRFGDTISNEVPMITQERAYTSPIWYTP